MANNQQKMLIPYGGPFLARVLLFSYRREVFALAIVPTNTGRSTTPATPASARPAWRRFAVLGLFVALIIGLLSAGAQGFFSSDALRDNRETLLAVVAGNYIAAVAVFMLVYVAAVTFSIPGAVWLSIAGGFIFSVGPATLFIVVAATIGATLVFLLARYVLGDMLRQKAGGAIERMRSGFQEDALSYMLVLRLVPLLPFFIVNLVPAFLNVPVRVYVLGTALGIIPGSFVFAWVGSGVGAVFDVGGDVDPGAIIFQPSVIGPLLGLAALALIPVVYKRFRPTPK
ncbi:MAG: VTT domain-containing protein [Rhodospirillaceae bacterium]|nr:VTT domain-containing protein [Rhodospirillaceae bacterium]